MQLSKYLLALAASVIVAEATEYPSYDKGKDGMESKYSHDVSYTTVKYDGNKYGYGDEEYGDKKTTHDMNKHHDQTKTHYEHTKTHDEYSKATHKDSSYTKHDDKHKGHGYHNSTSIEEYTVEHDMYKTSTVVDYLKYTKTVTSTVEYYYHGSTTTEYHEYVMTQTVTSTITDDMYQSYTTAAAVYSEESPYIVTETAAAYSEPPSYVVTDSAMYSESPAYVVTNTAAYSEASYMAADMTTESLSFDVFSMSSCTSCITDVAIITAPASSQDYTAAAETYAPAVITTQPPYYSVPSTMVTYAPYMMSSYAPSAGVATSSLAAFTGSAGRAGVNFWLVAVVSALVGAVMWV